MVMFPGGEKRRFYQRDLKVVDPEEHVAHVMVHDDASASSRAQDSRVFKIQEDSVTGAMAFASVGAFEPVGAFESVKQRPQLVSTAEEVFSCLDDCDGCPMLDGADLETGRTIRRLWPGDTLRAVPGHEEVVTPAGDIWRLFSAPASRTGPAREGYVQLSDKGGKEYVRSLRPRWSPMAKFHRPYAAAARFFNSQSSTQSLYTRTIAPAAFVQVSVCLYSLRKAPALFRKYVGGNPIRIHDSIASLESIEESARETGEYMPAWAGFCYGTKVTNIGLAPVPPCPLQLKKWWRACRKGIVKECLCLFVMLARARADYAESYATFQHYCRPGRQRLRANPTVREQC